MFINYLNQRRPLAPEGHTLLKRGDLLMNLRVEIQTPARPLTNSAEVGLRKQSRAVSQQPVPAGGSIGIEGFPILNNIIQS